MKNLFILFIMLILGILESKSAILTVSNTTNLPGNPGQYTTPQAAHDAAYSGDTIMIQGSPTAYPDFTITKKITIIGPGYNPIQRENTNMASVSSINLSNGASNTKIMGMNITGYLNFQNSLAMSNIVITRNKIGSYLDALYCYASLSNVEVYNNVIYNIRGNTTHCTNWNIKNNILNNIGYFQSSTIIIANNLFINSSGTGLGQLSNATISNNIFYGISPYATDVTLCAFNNNLTYNCTNPTLPYGTNVGSGNKISTDPMFLSVPSTTVTYTYNYRLNSSSPAKNAGTDGTDIGLTGGTYPIYQTTTDILTGEPPVPKVTSLTMPATSVPAGGNLQFTVKAKKVN